MDHLKSISTEMGITCLVNLHQVEVAQHYSDRIIGLNKGEIVFYGAGSELSEEQIQQNLRNKTKDLITA